MYQLFPIVVNGSMSLVLLCIASMVASSNGKSVQNFDTVATIDMRINPVHQGNYYSNNTITGGSSEAGDQGTMDMLATLKEQVAKLGEAVSGLQHQQGPAPRCTVNACLTCQKSIVDGTQHPKPRIYDPSHVLIDSCDDPSDPFTDADIVDWWVPPNGAILDKGFFELDLGCQKCVSKVTVRNSGNGSAKDRGTNGFLVSVATEAEPDTWVPVARGELESIRGVVCEEQPGKLTWHFAAIQARYARFEALSFYGHGAALQFFDIY